MDELVERFETGLDQDRWVGSYLPAWSSRAESAATWSADGDGLHLTIPADHPRWCPDTHAEPLRVSGVQSGSWSGPIGSTRGQQPFREGLVVREAQPELWGIVVHRGRVEVECRADVGPGSMFSAWMVGMEDEPDRCGEICLVEVFGDSVVDGTVALGSGVHPFRDPALVEEFSADTASLDVGDWHTYAVEWRADGITWFLDGRVVRESEQSPGYPMMLILAVFDFPSQRRDDHVPRFDVRQVRVDDRAGPGR